MKPILTIVVGLMAILLVGTLVSRAGRPSRPARGRVAVAAASDVRYALEALVGELERVHPDLDVSVSYGSSGNFYAQISNGAPFDVFLSADMLYPRQLIANGHVDAGSQFLYAEGRLAVWVPAASTLDVERLGLDVLADPAVTRVAIANPEHAPYGRAALSALGAAGMLGVVQPKLVLGENVSQAFQFVESGAADAGIVALSLALAPVARDAGRYWVVPADAHPRLEQGGVVMRSAADQDAAARFRAFMVGEVGREILARYGFSFPYGGVAAGPEG